MRFNELVDYDWSGGKQIKFSLATLLEVVATPGAAPLYYAMEKELPGEFIKYTNNAGYVNTLDFQPILQVCDAMCLSCDPSLSRLLCRPV